MLSLECVINKSIIFKMKIKNKFSLKKVKKQKKYSLNLSLNQIKWEKMEKVFSLDRNIFLKKIKKDDDNKPDAKELLKILAAGSIIVLSFAVPTLPLALSPFISSKRFDQSRFNQIFHRLKKQKLVKVVYEKGIPTVRITNAGKVRALRYKMEEMIIKKPQTWDKKWRIVIFDIPEKHKNMREIFRRHLQVMGFFMLQKSVWVHPYSCFDEIEFLRQIYHVGVNVTYIIADKIESSDNLKSFFDL